MQGCRSLASGRVNACCRFVLSTPGPSTFAASSSSSSSSRSFASSSPSDRQASDIGSESSKPQQYSQDSSRPAQGSQTKHGLSREELRAKHELEELQAQRERVNELRQIAETYAPVHDSASTRVSTAALLGDEASQSTSRPEEDAAEWQALEGDSDQSDELIHCRDWLERKRQLAQLTAAAESRANGVPEADVPHPVAGFAKGTLVYTDSNSYSGVAVVLDTVLLQTLSLRLLLISGDIVYEPASAITHKFKRRLPKTLASNVGESDSIRLCTALNHKARRTAIRMIRQVNHAESEARSEIESLMRGAWERLRSPVADERALVASEDLESLILEGAADRLLEREQAFTAGSPTKEAQETLAHELWRSAGDWERREEILRFSLQRYLLAGSDKWICESGRDAWSLTRWRARSVQEVTEMATVRAMIEKQSPEMLTFVKKAQALIDHSRPALDAPPPESSSHPAAPQLVSANSSLPRFTEMDLLILRHIQASFIVSQRQTSPFFQTVPWILKRTQRYGEVFDAECTARFLVEVGVRCQWDNWAALGSPLDLVKGERRVDQRVAPKASAPKKASKATARRSSTSALGPDDLYPADLVDHLRHDFGQLDVFVIDDPDAAELDDGVSIERCADPRRVWLHIHIADPTTLLHPGHRLAKTALARGSTAYLPEGNYPLLPDSLTLDRFSLGGKGGVVDPVNGQEALSFSALLDLDTGEAVDYKVRAGIIRNVHVTSYQAVNTALDCQTTPSLWPIGQPPAQFSKTNPRPFKPEWLPDIQLLQEAAQAIHRRRFRAGMIAWSSAEYQTKVFPSPLPSLPLEPTPRPVFSQNAPFVAYRVTPANRGISASQQVVQSCMTLAGNIAGRFFHDRGITTAYRYSPAAVSKTKEGLEELLASRDPQAGTVRAIDMDRLGIVLQAGRLSLQPETHWAMGITAAEGGYVRVTSPLRRYSDIIAHWQIKQALLAEASQSSAAAAARTPRSAEIFTAAEVFKWSSSVELTSKLVQDVSDRSKAFWGVYALQRHARQKSTLGAHAHNVYPPAHHYPFARSPVAPTARLGPFTDAVVVRSNVQALQPLARTVSVDIPDLGLQVEAHYPKSAVYGPGDVVSVLIDEFYLGPRPRLVGTIVA